MTVFSSVTISLCKAIPFVRLYTMKLLQYVAFLATMTRAQQNEAAADSTSIPLRTLGPVQSNSTPTVPTTQPTRVNESPRRPINGVPFDCTSLTERKEVREMKADGDWEGFVRAFKNLARDGTLSRFINDHIRILHALSLFNHFTYCIVNWTHAHFTSYFLPWHRAYLKHFEIELQKRGAKYLPYWDNAAGI
jgi:hypothetical protein